MNSQLQTWLEELRSDGLRLTGEAASGANQNLWCLSVSSSEQIGVVDLLQFLTAAVAIRRELAVAQPVRPVTFYAWHDEAARQLRFSTAVCTSDTLPFASNLFLVGDPGEIVADFIRSPYRDGIPSRGLQGCAVEDCEAQNLPEAFLLEVWAVDLCARPTGTDTLGAGR